MKKIFSLSTFLALATSIWGQQAIVASGGNAGSSAGSVSYSVGQISYHAITAGSNIIIEGLQQPQSIAGDPLPISLLYFEAKEAYSPDRVLLRWQVVADQSTEKFIIERSSDAKKFTYLLEQPTKTHSENTISYETIDHRPLMGNSYYRLKQTEQSGSYSYSKVKPVYFGAYQTMKVAPNPAGSYVLLMLSGTIQEHMIYVLTDNNGRSLLKGKITKTQTRIALNGLAEGAYILNVFQSGNRIKTFKIIKNQ